MKRMLVVAVLVASFALAGCRSDDATYFGCLLRDNTSNPCN
jgi:uncharacterized protein YcfL